MFDEPSLGLSPKNVTAIFELIGRIKDDFPVSMLIADQNAIATLAVSNYGYVMEQGHIVLEGPSADLRENPEIRAAYLGGMQKN
jgi:branched-chain amino acid transport system ATP-binding protein